MRLGMKIIHQFIFFILFVSSTVFANVLPERNVTVEQVNSFKKEVEGKLNHIPKTQLQLYIQQNWVITELSAVTSIMQGLNSSKNNIDFKELKTDLFKILQEYRSIDCEKPSQAKKDIWRVDRDLSNIKSIFFINRFRRVKEWEEVKKLFMDINDVNRDDSPAFTSADCKIILSGLNKPDSKEIITNLFDFISNRDKESARKQEVLKSSLQDLKNKLIEYSEKVSKSLDKVDSKKSLEKNLPLMILIIGGLSIFAIFIVRWFPEKVMQEWVESGQVIQFVTVMLLLSVIMTLGLADLLTENTLGTLLGGIGGYVLSQGVGRSAARRAIKDIQDDLKK